MAESSTGLQFDNDVSTLPDLVEGLVKFESKDMSTIFGVGDRYVHSTADVLVDVFNSGLETAKSMLARLKREGPKPPINQTGVHSSEIPQSVVDKLSTDVTLTLTPEGEVRRARSDTLSEEHFVEEATPPETSALTSDLTVRPLSVMRVRNMLKKSFCTDKWNSILSERPIVVTPKQMSVLAPTLGDESLLLINLTTYEIDAEIELSGLISEVMRAPLLIGLGMQQGFQVIAVGKTLEMTFGCTACGDKGLHSCRMPTFDVYENSMDESGDVLIGRLSFMMSVVLLVCMFTRDHSTNTVHLIQADRILKGIAKAGITVPTWLFTLNDNVAATGISFTQLSSLSAVRVQQDGIKSYSQTNWMASGMMVSDGKKNCLPVIGMGGPVATLSRESDFRTTADEIFSTGVAIGREDMPGTDYINGKVVRVDQSIAPSDGTDHVARIVSIFHTRTSTPKTFKLQGEYTLSLVISFKQTKKRSTSEITVSLTVDERVEYEAGRLTPIDLIANNEPVGDQAANIERVRGSVDLDSIRVKKVLTKVDGGADSNSLARLCEEADTQTLEVKRIEKDLPFCIIPTVILDHPTRELVFSSNLPVLPIPEGLSRAGLSYALQCLGFDAKARKITDESIEDCRYSLADVNTLVGKQLVNLDLPSEFVQGEVINVGAIAASGTIVDAVAVVRAISSGVTATVGGGATFLKGVVKVNQAEFMKWLRTSDTEQKYNEWINEVMADLRCFTLASSGHATTYVVNEYVLAYVYNLLSKASIPDTFIREFYDVRRGPTFDHKETTVNKISVMCPLNSYPRYERFALYPSLVSATSYARGRSGLQDAIDQGDFSATVLNGLKYQVADKPAEPIKVMLTNMIDADCMILDGNPAVKGSSEPSSWLGKEVERNAPILGYIENVCNWRLFLIGGVTGPGVAAFAGRMLLIPFSKFRAGLGIIETVGTEPEGDEKFTVAVVKSRNVPVSVALFPEISAVGNSTAEKRHGMIRYLMYYYVSCYQLFVATISSQSIALSERHSHKPMTPVTINADAEVIVDERTFQSVIATLVGTSGSRPDRRERALIYIVINRISLLRQILGLSAPPYNILVSELVGKVRASMGKRSANGGLVGSVDLGI